MNKYCYKLFNTEYFKFCMGLAGLLVILPIVEAIVSLMHGLHDGAKATGLAAILGAVLVYIVFSSHNQILCITDEGLRFKGRFSNKFLPWKEISSVKLISTRLSFSIRKAYVTSALIIDSKDHRFPVHGAAPHSEEIIKLLKEHLPDAFVDL